MTLALLAACRSREIFVPVPLDFPVVVGEPEPVAFAPPQDSGGPTTTPYEDCASGATEEEVAASVAMVDPLVDGLAELIDHGNRTYGASLSVTGVVLTNLLALPGGELPADFTTKGDGVYTSTDGGATTTMRFALGEDLYLGTTGSIITADVFDWDNYLGGSSASVDLLTLSVTVTFTSVGPLVELLGLGPAPVSPLELTYDEVLALGGPLRRLEVDADLVVDTTFAGSAVSYVAEAEAKSAEEIVLDGGFGWELVSSQIDGPAGESVVIEIFEMAYEDTPDVLLGIVNFEIRGSPVELDGSIRYPSSDRGIVTLSCP